MGGVAVRCWYGWYRTMGRGILVDQFFGTKNVMSFMFKEEVWLSTCVWMNGLHDDAHAPLYGME